MTDSAATEIKPLGADPPELETLELEVDGQVGTLTLNRPDALNAMSPELIGELTTAAAWLADRAPIRALIVTGAGRAFCSGLTGRAPPRLELVRRHHLLDRDRGPFGPEGGDDVDQFPLHDLRLVRRLPAGGQVRVVDGFQDGVEVPLPGTRQERLAQFLRQFLRVGFRVLRRGRDPGDPAATAAEGTTAMRERHMAKPGSGIRNPIKDTAAGHPRDRDFANAASSPHWVFGQLGLRPDGLDPGDGGLRVRRDAGGEQVRGGGQGTPAVAQGTVHVHRPLRDPGQEPGGGLRGVARPTGPPRPGPGTSGNGAGPGTGPGRGIRRPGRGRRGTGARPRPPPPPGAATAGPDTRSPPPGRSAAPASSAARSGTTPR